MSIKVETARVISFSAARPVNTPGFSMELYINQNTFFGCTMRPEQILELATLGVIVVVADQRTAQAIRSGFSSTGQTEFDTLLGAKRIIVPAK